MKAILQLMNENQFDFNFTFLSCNIVKFLSLLNFFNFFFGRRKKEINWLYNFARKIVRRKKNFTTTSLQRKLTNFFPVSFQHWTNNNIISWTLLYTYIRFCFSFQYCLTNWFRKIVTFCWIRCLFHKNDFFINCYLRATDFLGIMFASAEQRYVLH